VNADWRALWWLAAATVVVATPGCVTGRTVAAQPEREVPAPATAPAQPLEPAPASTAPVEVVPQPPPDPHPVVLALVGRAVKWAPAIEPRVAELSLEGTGFADTSRTLAYLRYRLLQDVVVPVLKLSYDRTLREYREALERAALFDDSHPLANLLGGPSEPAACERCVAAGTPCLPPCERERSRLRPAVLAAAELDGQLAFEGHPAAGVASSARTEDVSFEGFLDAAVEAGLQRSRVENALAAIVDDVVWRCRGVEGPVSADVAKGLPGYQALLLGYRRWEQTYAHDREPNEISADPIVVDSAGHLEAYSRFEQAILRNVPALHRHASELRRYREQLVALERGSATAKPSDERPAIDCTVLQPNDARRCTEVTVALHALDLDVTEAVLSGDELLTSALGVRVGMALEHLSLGAIQDRAIDAAFARLLVDLGQRGSPRMEL